MMNYRMNYFLKYKSELADFSLKLALVCVVLLASNTFAAQDVGVSPKKTERCDILFKAVGACAQINFIVPPNRKKSSDFNLKIFNINSQNAKENLISNVAKELKVITWLWMEMPGQEGHGSDTIKLTEQANYNYLGQNVWFLMEGDWQLHVQLRKNGKVIAQGHKTYCVAGRKHKCL